MFEELFDQDYIQQNYMDSVWEKGKAEGKEEGRAEGIIKSILAICDLLSPERIAERFQLSVDEVISILRANGKAV